MKKQTAVEWLVEELEKHHTKIDIKNTVAFNQAKAMEKEQIKNAYILPLSSEYWFKDEDFFQTESEQYYNQTYES